MRSAISSRRFDAINKYAKPIPSEISSGALSFFTWGKTSSGVSITQDNSLEINAVLTCVRVISESIASLPLKFMYREESTDTVRPAYEDERYWIFHERPNDEMTSYELRAWMMVDALIRGNGYAQVLRDFSGRILEVWPLSANKIKPKRLKSGQLVYAYPTQDKKGEALLESNEVLHIKGFINGGLVGRSIIDLQKNMLGNAKAAENYSGEFFGNATVPSGVVSVPEELSDQAYLRLKADWKELYSGEGKRHGCPILEGGAKFEPTTLNHEETQLLETRKFSRSEIAGLFRVPAHLINDLEKATFSNIEHQDLGYVKHTLIPWLTNWEQRLKLTCCAKEERSSFYFLHNVDNLLRGDLKSRAEAYSSFVQNGILSPNDVRRKESENPYEGGDEYLINGTLRPVSQAGVDSTPASQTKQPTAAELRLLD
jgi:HK97 family phage portal protein